MKFIYFTAGLLRVSLQLHKWGGRGAEGAEGVGDWGWGGGVPLPTGEGTVPPLQKNV